MAGGKHNIVILGGGFAGVRAALDLAAKSNQLERHRIVLIDRNTYHLYSPWMYEHAATAAVPREQLKLPFQTIFRGKPVEVLRGEVVSIDRHAKEIVLQSKQVIPYDILVLACGSVPNDFGIPGVKRYGMILKTIDDADRVRTTIKERFLRFLEAHSDGDVFQVLIGGGGATGSEFSAQLHSYMKSIARTVAHDDGTFLIKIIEASPRLLGGMDDWIATKAQQRLGSYRRIEVLLQHKIERVTAATISIANGDTLAYDVFIWTGGVQANPLVTAAGVPTTNRCRAKVTMTLQSIADPRVFVIGDSALCINPSTQAQTREIAESAHRQGAHAARNIRRLIDGQQLLDFDHTLHGTLIPLRNQWSISTVFGIRLTGRFGYAVLQLVNLRYLLSVLPPADAVRRWLS